MEGEEKKFAHHSEARKNLKIDLMPHQLIALSWMLHQEEQPVSGGILADDMGVGKTVSMISLIVESPKTPKDKSLGGTLLIIPTSLIDQWKNEIESKTTKGLLSVEIYHGPKRSTDSKSLIKKDVVITTYGIVVRETKNQPLFTINWRRIVLDEAHQIRNCKNKTAMAIFELSAKSRWAITGTPVHNSAEDLYSLFKFLRYAPYDDFKKWTLLFADPVNFAKAMSKIILRRTKSELQLQTLPQKTTQVVKVELNKDERAIYDYIMNISRQGRAQFFQEANTEKEIKQYHILVVLLILRQICCHPNLILQKLEEDDATYALEDFKKVNTTNHSDLNLSDPVFNVENPSSKIQHLLTLLRKIISQKEKAVIVSEWTSFLDIIAKHIKNEKISFDSLTGKTESSDRTTLVDKFNDPESDIQVLLLSLKAGGVGLNLVGANNLFLMDPHWNPQLENQAQDRVHRIGQKKPVHIYKFLTCDTVEERIKKLQDKKIAIADSVLEPNKQLSKEELKILLQENYSQDCQSDFKIKVEF